MSAVPVTMGKYPPFLPLFLDLDRASLRYALFERIASIPCNIVFQNTNAMLPVS